MLQLLIFFVIISSVENSIIKSAIGCKNEASLYEFMACFDQFIQNNGIITQSEYEHKMAPTGEELTEWRRLSSEILKTTDNRSCESIEISNTLKSNVFLGPVRFCAPESSICKDFCLLFETKLDETGHFARGFGIFATILNPGPKNIHISAAHPVTDSNVHFQAAFVTENTKGIKSVTVTGAKRRLVKNGVSKCQTNYGQSDAAHNTQLAFHESIIASRDWQLAIGCNTLNCGFIQLHGMADSSCGDDTVFISPGFSSEKFYTQELPVVKITNLLQKANPNWNVRNPTTSGCKLVARSNVFGRVLNGVQEGNECYEKASIRKGKIFPFVHIESKFEAIQPYTFGVWPGVIEKTFNIE